MSFDYQKLGPLAHNTIFCGSGGIAPLTYKVSESGERIIDERPRCTEQHRRDDQNDRMYAAQLGGKYDRRPQQ
jgi:hypothetical protein